MPCSRYPIDAIELETERIIRIRRTLVECNGTCVSFDSNRTGCNLIGDNEIIVTSPDVLYTVFLRMILEDNEKYVIDIWGSETLVVHSYSQPPMNPVPFPFWRVFLCMYRMGFRPNDICSTVMYAPGSFGVHWESLFKCITSWTFDANLFSFKSHPIYYAKVMSDISHHIVTSLKVKCACCGRSVKILKWPYHSMFCNTHQVSEAASHVKTSKKRKGRHLESGVWINTQPPVGVHDTPLVLANWTPNFPPTGVQATPPMLPGLVDAPLAYPFKTFAFGGPKWGDLHGRHLLPLPSGTEELLSCYGALTPPLTAEEAMSWDSDPINLKIWREWDKWC